MDIVCKLFGMCLTIIPSLYFACYIIKKATEEQRFDLHLKKVNDKKGIFGVCIAYLNRICLFVLVTIMGLYVTSMFKNGLLLDLIIVLLIVYIISCFIDNRNDI